MNKTKVLFLKVFKIIDRIAHRVFLAFNFVQYSLGYFSNRLDQLNSYIPLSGNTSSVRKAHYCTFIMPEWRLLNASQRCRAASRKIVAANEMYLQIDCVFCNSQTLYGTRKGLPLLE